MKPSRSRAKATVRRVSQWFAERQQDAAADITLVGAIRSEPGVAPTPSGHNGRYQVIALTLLRGSAELLAGIPPAEKGFDKYGCPAPSNSTIRSGFPVIISAFV